MSRKKRMAQKNAKKGSNKPKSVIRKKPKSNKKIIKINILAPKSFNEQELGVTITKDPLQVVGRTIKVSLRDLSGKFSQQHIKLTFLVDKLRGDRAHTSLYKVELNRGYLKRLTRRRRSKIEGVFDCVTKDKLIVRVKLNTFTVKQITSTQKSAIRTIMKDYCLKNVRSRVYSDLMQDIVFGRFSSSLVKKCHVICPIKRIEVRKTELKSKPVLEIPKLGKKATQAVSAPVVATPA